MNRGLTLMTGFFGIFALVGFVTFVTRQEGFLVFLGLLPVIWLYSLFDAVQMLHRKQRGEEPEDRTVLEDLDRMREDGSKSTILATVLAIMPGAGQMYLGLQRRGLQLMALFLFSLYFLDVLNFSLLLFCIPLIWFYSFFDALQQISRYRRSDGALQDEPVADWLVYRQKWLGIGLIAFGCFYLFERLLADVLETWIPLSRYWVDRYFQTVVIALLLIGGGIRLMMGKRNRDGEGER